MQFMSNNGPFAGQGGEVRHLAQPARPPVQGDEVERRAAGRGDRLARHLRRARPRRAAPVGAHRDDAARGLRADGLAAAGHLQDRRGRREARAVRGGRHRPRRGLLGRRHRGARAPRRPHAGDGAGGRGAHAPRVPLPGARPHRLPLAVPDRHARHRASSTTTSRTTARSPGTIRSRAERRAHLRRTTARPTPTASSTCRSAGSSSWGRGIKVYGGQIIGLHSRDNDLVVNPSKAKKLTNIRTTAADEKLFLTPPRAFSLEAALEFINHDELVEVTPVALRLRKRFLDHNERKRLEKAREAGLQGD